MSKNCLFCPKKESSITQKVLIEIFFNVISHLIYMIWLDLDVKPAPDTGTPSVEAHWGTVRPISFILLLKPMFQVVSSIPDQYHKLVHKVKQR